MKIAHIITRLIIGGAQENTILSCRGLKQRGHDVTLIAGPETGPEGSLWEQAQASAGNTVRIESLLRNVSLAAEWRCVKELTQLLRRERYDIVHTHSSKAGILGRYAAKRAGTRHIVHTIHGMSFNRTQSSGRQWLYKILERRAAKWTDAFITVADAMAEQAVAAGLADRSRFTTVYSGMNTDRFHRDVQARDMSRSQWKIPADAVVIGTVARLFVNKGYEQLLEALPSVVANYPKAHFVWVGDGAQRGAYEQTLERMDLRHRVHFTGLVDPDEIPRLLNGFDILVHASKWEGLPRALVQGALTELPCVSFDNDGAPEVIEDGVTGFLVRFGDVTMLAERVARLVSDADARRRMGQAARDRCLGRFDADGMVDGIEKVYQRLTDGGGSAATVGG